MQSGKKETFLNLSQKSLIILLFTLILIFLLGFKNFIFQPTYLLKKFGESSIDPEIAFTNNKRDIDRRVCGWMEGI